tara:strand:- start:529 stop:1443 length:915 start_codon:yes stop_codon:yes gene_type:complete
MPIVKFEENLIEISEGNTWDEATKEWAFVNCEKKDSKDNHCLCGFPLKNQYYYVNRNTNKYICCGYGCKKHIDPFIVKVNDKRYTSDLKDFIVDELIDYDLEAYCLANKERIFNKFINNIDKYNTEDELIEYSEYLNQYWFELDLDDIFDRIDEKLQLLNDIAEQKKLQHEALLKKKNEILLAKQKRIDDEIKNREEVERRVIKSKKRKAAEKEALKLALEKKNKEDGYKDYCEVIRIITKYNMCDVDKQKIIERLTWDMRNIIYTNSKVIIEPRSVRALSNEAVYGEEELALKMLQEEDLIVK